MRFIFKTPSIQYLRSRGLLFPVSVMLIVAGVLIHGAFERSIVTDVTQGKKIEEVTPSHSGNRPDVEKTILAYEADFWLQLAQRSRDKISLVSSKGIPAIHITPTLAVASIEAAKQLRRDRQERQLLIDRAFKTGGNEVEVQVGENNDDVPLPPNDDEGFAIEEDQRQRSILNLVAVDARLGLALFEFTQPSEKSFSLIDPTTLPVGSFVAALTVTHDNRLNINPGYLVSADSPNVTTEGVKSFEVSLELSKMSAVAAILDLDGNLVGLALNSSEGMHALSAPSVLQFVNQLTEQSLCYSIEVSDLTGSVADLLGLRNGVFVERVLERSFMPLPSIEAGDVILRWAGQDIENSEQFYNLYGIQVPGNVIRYVVYRNKQRIRGGTILPGRDCRPIGEPLLSLVKMGLVLEWNSEPPDQGQKSAWEVAAVLQDAPASKSGLALHDKILSVNGVQLHRKNTARILSFFESQNRPLVLMARRDDRVKLLIVSLDEVNID